MICSFVLARPSICRNSRMYAGAQDDSLAGGSLGVVLNALEAGVRLSLLDGRLCCRAARGSDVGEHVSAIERSSAECTRLLLECAGKSSGTSSGAKRDRVDFAPLSLSQLSHWRFHELGTRWSTRTCGLALRFHHPLEEETLKETIDEICSRHEALRTRIVTLRGTPVQCVHAAATWGLALEDLTSIEARAREKELNRLIVKYHLEPVDVSTDPLLSVVLIKLDERDRVLFLAMDHLISDGISVNVLQRELLTIYARKAAGRAFALALPVQFADYSIWERKRYREWIATRGAYWSRHLAGSKALRLSSAASVRQPSIAGLQCTPMHLDNETTAALVRWSRGAGTTAAMAVFTAFTALLLRWYEVSEAVVQYQTHGRFAPELQDSIGYFAFRRYLRIGVQANDRLIDFMHSVAAEYMNSLENETFPCAGVADVLGELARNPCFNWLTRDQPDDHGALVPSLGSQRIRYEDTIREITGIRGETDLLVALAEMGDEIYGVVQCPQGAIARQAMERFASNLLFFLETLMEHPERRIGEITLLR